MLRIAITKNATPVQVRLRVKNQTTPATIIAGNSKKKVRSTASMNTATISNMIRIISSEVGGKNAIAAHICFNCFRAALWLCGAQSGKAAYSLPLPTDLKFTANMPQRQVH